MSVDMLAVNRILVALLIFTLVLIRCGCLVMFAPFFGSESFPMQFRIGLAAGLSLLLLQSAAGTAEIPERLEMLDIALLAGQEFSLGMSIAFLATLVFTGVQLAGEIAGQQIGFSMANVVDPVSNVEVPLLGFINMNIAITMFITAKLHLVLVYIMAQSYKYVGIGFLMPEVNSRNPVLTMSLSQAHGIIMLGIRLAMPVMMIMLMNSIVEGFVAKTMPQMNIMVLGMPLRVVLGVSSLVFIYPAMCVALIPPDWTFNLHDMPDGPIGDMLLDLSEMVREVGEGTGGN